MRRNSSNIWLFILLAAQHALAAAYGTKPVIIPAAAHDLMRDPAWPQATDVITRIVAQWTRAT